MRKININNSLRSRIRCDNQSGQAGIEYILILLVIVALAMMLRQLYEPLRLWTDRHFSAYLSCLLEVGELPQFAGEVCNEGSSADLARTMRQVQIRNPMGEGGGAGGINGNRTGGSNAAALNAEEARRRAGRRPSSAATAEAVTNTPGGGGGGGFAGRSPRFASRGGRSQFGQGGSAAGRTSAGDPGAGKSSNLEAINGGSVEGRRKVADRKKRDTDDSGLSGYEMDRRDRKVVARSQTSVKTDDEGNDRRPTRLKANRSGPKAEVIEEKPWSFGDYLRIMIIIAIIVALFFLIGGQALQLSKSSEK